MVRIVRQMLSSLGGAATRQTEANLKVRGIEITRDPKYNKGMAFTVKERQALGIHGLLPPAVITQDQQAYRIMLNFHRLTSNLEKYMYLTSLQDRNEKLFHRVIRENAEEMLPIVYTPTVGQACQKWGLIYRRARGLFVTVHDIGHVYSILCNWPEDHVKCVVVTDGERILGLGDLGTYGMGLAVGKVSLYTAIAGLKPEECLPIFLDVGTQNDEQMEDPLYIGLRHKRIRDERYFQLIDELMEGIAERYGQKTLVQFEGFSNRHAFKILEKYQKNYVTFNDDIQGTAAVALAGLLASCRVTGRGISEHKFFFNGAGEAACGIANLLVTQMKREGLTEEQATARIWMNDRHGFVVESREGGCAGHKARYAKKEEWTDDFQSMIDLVKPSVLIGAAGQGGQFNKEVLNKMAKWNEQPIVFALSTPIENAECTAEEVFEYTDGRAVFASGSYFEPVKFKGLKFYPSQGNNAYIFPGIAAGVISVGARQVTDEMFLTAATVCSEMVTGEELARGRTYPPLSKVTEVTLAIAEAVAEEAYETGVATRARPRDLRNFLRSQRYLSEYLSFKPSSWDWPEENNKTWRAPT